MKHELQMKLVEEFPVIFRDYGGDMRKTCMAWGICTGDGWYDIIYTLCKQIEDIINGTSTKVIASQVKEKFGSLRFYIQIEKFISRKQVDLIHNAIDIATIKSVKTCEDCGEPGEPGKSNSDGYWVKTLCDNCRKKE